MVAARNLGLPPLGAIRRASAGVGARDTSLSICSCMYSMATTSFALRPHSERRAMSNWTLRRQGETPTEIAVHGGAAAGDVRAALVQTFEEDREQGVLLGETKPEQATRIFRRQLQRLSFWMLRPEPPRDLTSTYGRATAIHGEHTAGWPRTAAQWRAEDRRAENVRRHLQPGCWPHIKRWRGPVPQDDAAARPSHWRPGSPRGAQTAFCRL